MFDKYFIYVILIDGVLQGGGWCLTNILMLYMKIYWKYIENILKIIENILKIYWKYIENIMRIYWKYIDGVLQGGREGGDQETEKQVNWPSQPESGIFIHKYVLV